MVPDFLHDGYRRFRADRYSTEAARYRELASGQSPDTMVVACADSRIDPATIFAARPGDLFVVRNVAALVPPCDPTAGYHGTSAALEYGVSELGVHHIVVLGHGLCGGIAASLGATENKPSGQFIGPWVELLSPIRDDMLTTEEHGRTPEQRQRSLEWRGILYSISNLREFPFIAAAVAAGRLQLHGAWFSIAEGALYWLDEVSGEFTSVDV